MSLARRAFSERMTSCVVDSWTALRFFLTLSPAAAGLMRRSPNESMTPLILLVENDEDHLMIYSTLLSHHGYSLITAPDADRGLELARSRRPACIVIDIQLDGSTGLDLLERLQDDAELREIPVVLHTAFADYYPDVRAVGVPIINKSDDPQRLVNALRAVVPPATT